MCPVVRNVDPLGAIPWKASHKGNLVISRKDKQQTTYFYIQLQNVSSSVQKGPNVGLCSPKVSVHKLFNVAGNTG